MSDFLKDIIKETGNEYATLAKDGVSGGDVDSFIDTGSYSFNALLSGSIYGGLPGNRITAIAGEAATGKTFFALGVVKSFLEANKDAGVIYFESENAISKELELSIEKQNLKDEGFKFTDKGNKYDKNRNVKPQEPDAMTCHFAKSATIFREFRNRVAKDSKYISMRKNWRQLEEA